MVPELRQARADTTNPANPMIDYDYGDDYAETPFQQAKRDFEKWLAGMKAAAYRAQARRPARPPVVRHFPRVLDRDLRRLALQQRRV